MSAFDLALLYYPRLWDKNRIEALVMAGKLTREEADEVINK